jgi:hypothetical protein
VVRIIGLVAIVGGYCVEVVLTGRGGVGDEQTNKRTNRLVRSDLRTLGSVVVHRPSGRFPGYTSPLSRVAGWWGRVGEPESKRLDIPLMKYHVVHEATTI